MPDTTPPFLRGIRFNPYTAQPDDNIVLSFNETVKLNNGGSITLRRADTGALVETLEVTVGGTSLTANGSSVTINPTKDLAYATDYYLTIEDGTIADTAGNPLKLATNQSSQTFTTAPNAEAPFLTRIDFSGPSRGQTQAEPDANIILNFSESVNLLNGATVTLRRASDDSKVDVLREGDGLTIVGSSITIDPHQDLDYATAYYLDLDPGSLRDDGHNSNGMQELTLGEGSFAFGTVTKPGAPNGYITYTHANGSGEPAADTDIVLNFGAPIELGNHGSVTVRRADTKAVVETLTVDGGRLTANGSSVTINPTQDLDYATKYYLTVEGGAIVDGANHEYKVSDNKTLAFVTGVDDIAPNLRGVSFSASGQDGRPKPGADITLTFSENVQLAAGQSSSSANAASITLRRADTQAVVETLTVAGGNLTASGSSVTINPTKDLDYATKYYLSFEGKVVTDAAGNAVTSPTKPFETTAAPVTPGPGPSDPSPPLIDGVAVTTQTQVRADGSSATVITVPVVSSGRANTDTTTPNADIPLVTNANGTVALAAQVPTGYGLQAIGAADPKPTDLVTAIRERTAPGSSDQTALTGSGSTFIGALPPSTNLIVQTIVPTVAPGATTAPTQPIVIQGQYLVGSANQQHAIVIDGSKLPKGGAFVIENIDFAAVIGSVTVSGGGSAALGEKKDSVLGADGSVALREALTTTPDPVRLFGDGADQTLIGGANDDLLSGGGGTDVLQGGRGADLVYGNQGSDLIYGNQGADRLYGGQDADRLYGGKDADLVYGNLGNDLIYGNMGADVLYGGQGDDRAYGGQDADTVSGNRGNDTLSGNLGADLVYGNQGQDVIYGNQGNDTLYGGQGDDILYGGQGDDTLVGGVGNDTLVGGVGADRYVFEANSGSDLILGFDQASGDRISLGGRGYVVTAAADGSAVLNLAGGGVVTLAGVNAAALQAQPDAYFA